MTCRNLLHSPLFGSMLCGILVVSSAARAEDYRTASPGSVQAAETRWELIQRQRSQYHRQQADDAIAKMKGRGDLRTQKIQDLEQHRQALSSQLNHRREMIPLRAEARHVARQEAAARREALQQDMAYTWNHERGGITWPTLLLQPQFAQARQQIDAQCAGWNRYHPQANPAQCLAIQQAVAELTTTLKGMVRTVDPARYCEAKRFLADLNTFATLSSQAAGQVSAAMPAVAALASK